MYEAIDQAIAKYVQLGKEELQLFHGLLKLKKVKKKSYLLQEGDVCTTESFVLKGCIRTYYLDKEGLETIISFAVEGWWVSDLTSFTDQVPSNMFIEALEDCELLQIDYASKMQLFEKIPKLERYFRLLVQRSLSVFQQRLYATVSQTAEERYLHFLDRYPQIVQRVPQHQIARYIGVSPEFLSKIRSGLLKKN
ncbi:MAG: Crp/Fnr family transcriptional regulator [Candidatus Pseudobacter hemicellulosilyticus]|uniref:Crp/Fnr family transcriptional regulator n=1 Tax=Candidatus Pseudobacter hemicellulosilyticus TaxID=3121375 RepID=A0AAJ6BJD1_9BACT|nr:MAG: Crp/Fnr family transcriptional regulator [Pseudobacter sp.]